MPSANLSIDPVDEKAAAPATAHATASKRSAWICALLSFAIVGVVAFSNIFGPENDFLSFYSGARLAGTEKLYSPDAAREIQRQAGSPNLRAYTRLPFFAAALAPLGRLPYRIAEKIWIAVLLAALGAFLALWFPDPLAVITASFSLPVWMCFSGAQDDFLLLLIVFGLLRLVRGKRPFWAGLLFALCAIKIHLFLLVPLLILAHRMWRFLGGLVVGGAILLAACFALQGPHWVAAYLDLLRQNETLARALTKMPGVAGLFGELPHPAPWVIAASLVIACLAFVAFRRTDIEASLALLLAAGVLVSPHAYAYDVVAFLPGLLLVARRSGPGIAQLASISVSIACLALPYSVHIVGQTALLLLFVLGAAALARSPVSSVRPAA